MSSTRFWNVLNVTPVVLGVFLWGVSNACAKEIVSDQIPEATSSFKLKDSTLDEKEFDTSNTATDTNPELLDQIQRYSSEGTTNSLDQVTNVGQLRDVSPGDWAYEALRSLVERYGCIAGYPDGTFRGNRAMTRYEFAAGLNACLQQIERLIVPGNDMSSDLETLRRLVQEFEAELATLGARVDNLEGRVAFLENHQFSTTTKLNGEAIFSIGGAFGDEKANNSDTDVDDNIVLQNRVRLDLDTSFTGKDRLRTRLESGNFDTNFGAATGTDMARLGYDNGESNDLRVADLIYRFPLGDKVRVWVGANEFDFDDMADKHNPFLENSGKGSLSRFVQRNPAIFRNGGSQGAGANIQLSDSLGLDVGYFTGDGQDPTDKNGLFNGDFSALAQLNVELGSAINVGFAYGYSYYPGEDVNLSGSTGSLISRRPFGAVATQAHRFGIQGSWRVAPKINLAGWGGLLLAEAKSGARDGDNAEIWNFAANVSFLDVGKEGAVFSLAGGMPPKATNVDNGAEDDATSWLVEAHYRYPITDNILITPGAYVIFNPNHDDSNDTVWVGVIRTTFSF
ncbi:MULTISPECIES: iron uptake porin [unclassified Coleofasciculus]|uniref:iron uptake porin n=1 Tax=unclassified Coleofasciculus TaxID=2692782 RepID=UPI001882ADEB|nr:MULTISPECIES: iron uptake porin [unclassified Coleofasciculus]MBE9128827.1 carbohydrate porin [Coleofasciculus sp. LEGE 07081]MBE9151535.1 carbohydrate porin [Coleofasciculus sp. LEGE 07092]